MKTVEKKKNRRPPARERGLHFRAAGFRSLRRPLAYVAGYESSKAIRIFRNLKNSGA